MKRRPCTILSALSLLLLFAGCHKYKPVEVHVFDARTTEALKGVAVEASVRYFMDPFHPKPSRAVTNEQGMALVRVCTNYSKGGDTAILVIQDQGYLLDDPMPKVVVDLPLGPVRAPLRQPHRVDVSLLTVEDWRHRYPSYSRSSSPR